MKKNIRRFCAWTLAFVVALILSLFFFEPRYSGSLKTTDNVLVFAHRGYGNHAPDNSLVGAEMALADSLDGVDVDGQFSADKKIVIFHDPSLERFTTGTGRVDSKTVEELRKYDLSIKFGSGFTQTFISTLEDFVTTVTPTGYLMVELKVPGTADTGIEREISALMQKHNAYDKMFVSSFNPIVLYRLKKIDPRIKTVFIFMDSGWDPQRVAETKEEDRVSLPWYLRTELTRRVIRKIIQPDALSIQQNVDESVIDTLIAKGNPVFLWPVNDAEHIQWALTKKPFGIISDEPLLAKELRDANR